MKRVVLRGAYALEGPRSCAVLTADETVDLSRRLLVPGLVNGPRHSHERSLATSIRPDTCPARFP